MDSTQNISRLSLLRARPNLAPLGPRTPSRHSVDSPSQSHSSAASQTSSPSIISPAYSTRTSPALSNPTVLPTVQEALTETIKSPFPDGLPPAYSTLSEQKPPKALAPPRPPRLVAPPEMKFESHPLQWKSLPLEAALWTFSSTELQQIVSRAIRSSARESFIRLLTVENLDRVLPAELERLEAVKATTQSKYRFLVHRRTMLLQALITSAQIPCYKDKDREDTMDSITKLSMQLSDTTIECDRLLEELIKVSDQTAQINRMLDVHWASALAIALRKLNNSYGRRTTELQHARDRITQLEAELEDAWKEAEKLAREMDEYEADLLSDTEGEAVIETAEVVSVPMTPTSPRPQSTGMAPKRVNTVDVPTPRTPLSPRDTEPTADIPADINGQEDHQDNISIRSAKSAKSIPSLKSTKSAQSLRSVKSTRSTRGETSRSQHVCAAKKRSYRASQGSLRLPPNQTRKQSISRPKTPVEEQPPVPDIPLHFNSPVLTSHTANASSTLLHWESPSASPVVFRNHGAEGISAPQPPPSSFHGPAGLDEISLDVDENLIEEVPRSPGRKNISLDDMRLGHGAQPLDSSGSPTSAIPSIWKNADTPKTPAERVESLMRQKSTPYQKLRTLTKRYSLPFPLFVSAGKSVGTRRSSDRS